MIVSGRAHKKPTTASNYLIDAMNNLAKEPPVTPTMIDEPPTGAAEEAAHEGIDDTEVFEK